MHANIVSYDVYGYVVPIYQAYAVPIAYPVQILWWYGDFVVVREAIS